MADIHTARRFRGKNGEKPGGLCISGQTANGNSHGCAWRNGQDDFSNVYKQACGKCSNILILKRKVCRHRVHNLRWNMHNPKAVCSYDVFHKLTPLMMRDEFFKFKLFKYNYQYRVGGKRMAKKHSTFVLF